MKEENTAILLAMIIGAVILGIGLAMFFNRPFTGYGAVVIAIGLMTLSLILTMRAEEIIHLRIYPTSARSETIPEISVETLSPTEVHEVEETRQAKEAPETQEYYETQEPPQEIEETQQVEETQEPWQTRETPEVEETERPYTPSMYEPEQEEERKLEPEYEPEPSIEASPPS